MATLIISFKTTDNPNRAIILQKQKLRLIEVK